MPEGPAPAPRPRHLKVRVNPALAAQLATFAAERELSLSDAVRVLLHQSLNPPRLPEEIMVLPAVGFASLLAAEQATTLLERIYSSWVRDHGHDIPNRTAEGARKRLEDVELALEEPRRRYRPWDEKPSGLSRYLNQVR